MLDIEKNDLLKHPNYLLSTYQLEIYRQLGLYMEKEDLKKKDIAAKLKVSSSYVSQILNGKFNFTLKKLVELGIAIGKVPYLQFVDVEEYWKRERDGYARENRHLRPIQKNTYINFNYYFNGVSENRSEVTIEAQMTAVVDVKLSTKNNY